MSNFRVVSDLEECQEVWNRAVPQEGISHLWQVRACFQKHFNRQPHFVVAENSDSVGGLLPLSWVEEGQYYGYFPGETWQGKTWLEQNLIHAADDTVLEGLLSRCPPRHHLRYLLPLQASPSDRYAVDEIGYLFEPPQYGYDIENYFQEFSHKSAKRIKREIASIEDLNVRYRLDDLSDFEHLVRLNVERFGSYSYFDDVRFLESFRSLMHCLNDSGWLRLTTIVIGGEVAAVDMGCIYRGVYTLLGGGTHAGYPGIAKLINLHHMRRACQERLSQVDFLCGDFSWKRLFHLAPRSLYLLSDCSIQIHPSEDVELRRAELVG